MRRRCDNVRFQNLAQLSDKQRANSVEHSLRMKKTSTNERLKKYINNNDHDVSKWLIEWSQNSSNDLLEYHWIWWQSEMKLKNTNIVYKMHWKTDEPIVLIVSDQIKWLNIWIWFNLTSGSCLSFRAFMTNWVYGRHVWRCHFSREKKYQKFCFFGVIFVAPKLNLRLRFHLMNFILNVHGKAYDLWIFRSKCSFLCLS